MADDPTREMLKKLRVRLGELEDERQKVLHAIEVIEDLFKPLSNITPHDSAPKGDSPTYPVAAEAILLEHGKPMHIKNILKAAKDRGWYPDKDLKDRNFRNSVVGSLDRKARDDDTFTRPAPATYGLLEWGKSARE